MKYAKYKFSERIVKFYIKNQKGFFLTKLQIIIGIISEIVFIISDIKLDYELSDLNYGMRIKNISGKKI